MFKITKQHSTRHYNIRYFANYSFILMLSQPTIDYGNACTVSRSPYISKCNYNAAFEILNHIYGGGLTVIMTSHVYFSFFFLFFFLLFFFFFFFSFFFFSFFFFFRISIFVVRYMGIHFADIYDPVHSVCPTLRNRVLRQRFCDLY